jgi:hypothetical protein
LSQTFSHEFGLNPDHYILADVFCFFREYEDLTTGQMMLQDLVERQGIPVFESVPVALNCTAKVSLQPFIVSYVSKCE